MDGASEESLPDEVWVLILRSLPCSSLMTITSLVGGLQKATLG